MARDSVSNSSSNLNLSRRQAALFQNIILAGSEMSEVLAALEEVLQLPKGSVKQATHWDDLMVELVEMLF